MAINGQLKFNFAKKPKYLKNNKYKQAHTNLAGRQLNQQKYKQGSKLKTKN